MNTAQNLSFLHNLREGGVNGHLQHTEPRRGERRTVSRCSIRRTIGDYGKEKPTRVNAIHKAFQMYFKKKTPEILRAVRP